MSKRKHRQPAVNRDVNGQALTLAERDMMRNLSDDQPSVKLHELGVISKTLLFAAGKTSVSVVDLGRYLGVSDAYADQLLRNLCAARLMFINHEQCSLEGGFVKTIAIHAAMVERMLVVQDARHGR